MSKKFPNVIIPVYHPDHLTAVVNEAERLGYRKDTDCPTFVRGVTDAQCVHLQPDGTMYAYAFNSAEVLVNYPHQRYEGSVVLNKLRKLRGLFEELNPVITESQDNQSQLIVRPNYIVVKQGTFKQDPHATIISDPDGYLCGCEVTRNERKTCAYKRAYGGTCIKSKSIPELAQVLEPVKTQGKVVYTVRPNLLGRVTRRLVLVGSILVASVLSSVSNLVKLFRGSK